MTSEKALYILLYWCNNNVSYKDFIKAREKIEKDLEVLEIVKTHKLLNYVIKNEKCAKMYNLTEKEINKIKEWLENE